MNVVYLLVASALVACTYGAPKPQNQNLVPGVFIPADAFKNLQDKANANSQLTSNVQNPQPINTANYQPPSNAQIPQPVNNQGYQPMTNIQNPQPIINQGYQPNSNVPNSQPTYQPTNTNQLQYQQPNNQPVVPLQPQPFQTNQPTQQVQPMIVDRMGETSTNPPNVMVANQPNPQPNQPIVYVQQPNTLPNQQAIFVPQTNKQPIVLTQQPNQGVVFQNGQPTNVIFTNLPNSNQIQGQNSGPVYTLIPLNGSNSNSNTGSYLIPIQSGNSNPIVLSTGN